MELAHFLLILITNSCFFSFLNPSCTCKFPVLMECLFIEAHRCSDLRLQIIPVVDGSQKQTNGESH